MIEVYLLESPSGRQYVGLTSAGFKTRWRSHTHSARHGSPYALHRAIRKYGAAAFTHRILERMSTEAGARQAERLWIAELGTQTNGYNETAGGDGVLSPSAEARARMGNRKGCSPETRAKIAATLTGRKLGPQTPEHRARIAAANTGNVPTAETRAKISAANTGRKHDPAMCARRGAAISAGKQAGAQARRAAKSAV